MLFGKKGQVTIFVIIGVILLITFGLIYHFYSSESNFKRGKLLVDDVSEEYSPIQDYVHSCIEKVGKDAIVILGKRGGYLFNQDYSSPSMFNLIPSEEDPTDSNSFYMFDVNSDLVIPYWFYMNYPNDGKQYGFKSEKPKLISDYDDGFKRLAKKDNSVESQIDLYVDLKLKSCLDDFRSFKDKGIIVTPENMPTATTYILDDHVQIQVDYPLIINNTLSEDSLKIERFGVDLDVRLKKTFELAEFISSIEADQNYLENDLINLIILNSMVNSELLAPLDDFTFAFGSEGKTWRVIDLKENMKYLLMQMNMLQVQGSKNYDPIQVPVKDQTYETRQKVYNNMIIPVLDYYGDKLTDSALVDAEVSFAYFDDWNYYFNVNDEGGEVKPEVMGVEFGPLAFGMQKYKTIYDVSWPVLVSIDDTKSFGGEGYVFNFGLEGNMRQNKPMNSTRYRNRLIGNYEKVPSICDNIQRNHTTEIKVVDSNFKPINGVSLILKTNFESCALGVTDSEGVLVTDMPSGVMNGLIVANKNGYLKEKVNFVQGAEGYEINGMQKLKSLKVNVFKRKLFYNDDNYELSGVSDLELGDEAIITFERLDVTGDDGKFSRSLVYTKDGGDEKRITLAPGSYDIKINLINKDKEVKIDDMEIKGKFIKGATFHGMMIGGVDFSYEENSDYSMYFDYDDLNASTELNLYTLDYDIDWNNPEEVSILSDIRAHTILFKEELIPELK